jgi:hypothetical protein
MAVNYRGNKFYNIGPWWQKLAADLTEYNENLKIAF